MTKKQAREILEKFATERIPTHDWDNVIGIVSRAILVLTQPERKKRGQ